MKQKAMFLVLFVLSVFSAFALGQKEGTNSIIVSGTGVVSIKPNAAKIDISVITRNASVELATRENALKMAAVQKAIQALGIDKDSFFTSRYNVYQESEYVNGKTVLGLYCTSNVITIIVKNLDTLGTVIDTSIKAGASQLSSLVFYATDTQAAINEARLLAVKQAQETAMLLTQVAGTKLGRVLHIQESNAPDQSYARQNMAMMADSYSGAPTPISPGLTEVKINVIIEYKLE